MIAALNGPQSVVIAGPREPVLAVAAQLAAEGIKTQQLNVSHAFHSPLMEPMLAAFRRVAQTITYHPPTMPLVTNLTGRLATADITTPEYWVRQVREPVQFAAGLATLYAQGVDTFLEIGPQPVLLNFAQESGAGSRQQTETAPTSPPTLYLPSLRPKQSDWQQMLSSLGEFYRQGAIIDWHGFDRDYHRRKVALPTYPFQRQRYWINAPKPKPGIDALRPLIDKKIRLPRQKQTLFEKQFSSETLPFLTDHQIYGEVVVPGACHLALALSGADLLFAGAPCVLEDVIFPQPLVLLVGEARTVQLVTEAQAQRSALAFQISSFAEEDGDGEPLLHATGQIARTDAIPAMLSLAELQARCETAVSPATLYETLAEAQVVLGPTFHWFAALWQGVTDEALAQLQLPAELSSVQGYPLFPSLIDAGFQLVGAAMLRDTPAETVATHLPFALDSLTLYGPTNHQALWCHAQRTSENKWNITFFTASGQVVAQLTGFQLRTVPSATIQGDRLRTDWLYTLAWEATPLPAAPTPAPDCWLLFGAADGVSARLAAALPTAPTGQRTPTILISPSPTFSLLPPTEPGGVQRATLDPTAPAMFRQLLSAVATHYQSVGIGYLWGLENALAHEDVPTQSLQLCAGLLHLVQALNGVALPTHLWIVTRACQTLPLASHMPQRFPNQKSETVTPVASGPLWGLGRTVALEEPRLHCVCIDVEATTADETQAELLRQEFSAGSSSAPGAIQVAYRNTTRYVAQLDRWQAPPLLAKSQPVRLQLRAYGSLDNLTFVPLVRRQPGPQEIEVEVKAAGLNLRDVLNALGLLQEYYRTVLGVTQASAVGLGFECAGVVTAVGEAVRGFAVGDRVMGLGAAAGAFASYITVPAAQMVAIPAHLDATAAATIPLAFLTAWYGLVELAKLQPGERVLIHAAAGGVGQAAVQIAQARGAEIFATASPSKWALLQRQGIPHILNSRTLAFAEEILQITNGRGVDVVFNSLNGAFIERSFATLGQRGRFVEIGKLGIWSQQEVQQRRPDVAYYPYDLGEALNQTPTLYATLWQAILTQLTAGTFQPLPYTPFPALDSASAFRMMQQARHVGKVVIVFDQPSPVILQQDAVYLITGGLGALGLHVAQQLVEAGASQLVLTSRHGVTTPEQRQQLAALEAAGAQITVLPADIANLSEAQQVIEQCTAIAPLRGLVHAAGVLADGVLTTQTLDHFAKVMRPKVNGAWHLHTLTQHLPLDFFVCFSSAAALLGSPGQSNYAAANAFLDILMQQRQQAGLPGLSINWGPWAAGGMAAHVHERLNAQAMTLLTPQQGKRLFQHLLNQPSAQIAVLPLKQRPQGEAKRAEQTAIRDHLASLPDQERQAHLEAYLRSEIAAVLGLALDTSIDQRTRLFDLGLDSLMAVELKNRIEAGLRCSIRSTLLFDYPTLEALTAYLLQEIFGHATAQPARDETQIQTNEPLNAARPTLEALSAAELDDLLEQELARLEA